MFRIHHCFGILSQISEKIIFAESQEAAQALSYVIATPSFTAHTGEPLQLAQRSGPEGETAAPTSVGIADGARTVNIPTRTTIPRRTTKDNIAQSAW